MKNVVVGKESIICEDANCYTLEYCILLTNGGEGCNDEVCPMYGFEVKKMAGGSILETVKIEKFTYDEKEIRKLVSLLRKNIVTPVTVYDVIEDLKSA